MNKTMEYMAYALPVVTFDLKETRRSAGSAAVYVKSGDVAAFAQAVSDLLDDPDKRARLAIEARRRVAAELDWSPQARAYVSVFDRLFGVTRPRRTEGTWPAVDRRHRRVAPGQLTDPYGRPLVDLRNATALEQFVRTRRVSGAVATDAAAAAAAAAERPPRRTSLAS